MDDGCARAQEAPARLCLLDGPALTTARGEVDLPVTAQRVLAHLALLGRRPRRALAAALWPQASEERALASLRSALWRVERSCAGVVRASSGSLALAGQVRVDTDELTTWARAALDTCMGVEALDADEALLRGELLPGWYDDWVLCERERLGQLRLHALEAVAAKLCAAGRLADGLEVAALAVSAEPLRESAHRVVMQLHLAEGNVAAALRQYELYRTTLRRELGVLPSARMTGLVQPLLELGRPDDRRDASLVPSQPTMPARSTGDAADARAR